MSIPPHALEIDPESSLQFIITCDPLHLNDGNDDDVSSSQSQCTIRLRHPGNTNSCLAFQVRTTHPRRYIVRPKQGIVAPNSSETVSIVLDEKYRQKLLTYCERMGTSHSNTQTIFRSKNDKFHVSCCIVPEELSAKFANELRMGEGGQYTKKLVKEFTAMWRTASENVPVSVYRKKLGVSHVVYTAGAPVADGEAATSGSSTGGVASVGNTESSSSSAVIVTLGYRVRCGAYLIMMLVPVSGFLTMVIGGGGTSFTVGSYLFFSPFFCLWLYFIIIFLGVSLLVFHEIVRRMMMRGWRAVCIVYIASFVALPVGIGLYVGTSNGKLGGVNVNVYRSGYICGKEQPTREDIAARGNISTCLDVQDLLSYGKNLCLQAGGLDKPAVWCNEEDDSFRSNYLWWSPCDKCGTGTAWRIFTSIDNDKDQSWYKRPTPTQPNKTDSPPDDGWLRWESSHNEWLEFDDDTVNITTCPMILPEAEVEATNISISEGARYDIPSSCFSDRIFSHQQQNPWNIAGYILLWIGGICWGLTFCAQ